ncbi:hypothetical protein OAG53_01265 [Akkermansiaceae bacterium]|nr:hypothetical protein [Akkermansiaceae bacterium]
MQKWFPLIIFVIILGVSRIIGALSPDTMPNLQPYGALFFCGMALFGVRWIWVPALAWFLSYPITSVMNGHGWDAELSVVLLGFAAVVGLAFFFHKKSTRTIFLGSLASAFLFYLITNTLSWALDPGYAKSLSGLGQALTVGLPGYLPSWIFFRNGFIAQAIFSGAFLYAYEAVKTHPILRSVQV